MIHIKTVEGLMQAVMNQLEYMKPENNQQTQCKQDMMDAIDEIQGKELMALRRVCE